VLSNFACAYDRYSRRYSKVGLEKSTFPDRFFLLSREEIEIGVAKASGLLDKLGLMGNRLLVLETRVDPSELQPNLRTGLGMFVPRSWIQLSAVYWMDERGGLRSERVEEVAAQSLALNMESVFAFDDLQPRSVSILPISKGCQAACPFCFSHASISADQNADSPNWQRIASVLEAALNRGATRAVITGGGEPGLLAGDDLRRMIGLCAKRFDKVVLISNGYAWARLGDQARLAALTGLQSAGLTVLSLSRHHHKASRNAELMGLDTQSERLAATWGDHRDQFPQLTLRWVCVLQRDGIATSWDVDSYMRWAARTGVPEVCFKELYVSTSVESVYHHKASNDWSHEHQVPLSVVLDLAEREGWARTGELPWGSPIFEAGPLIVAAYTEPSLLWELSSGTCRSWNLMADGRCFASLESRDSEVCSS
jgi:molybdenum cofactor biosynthesis enzyme MoaA